MRFYVSYLLVATTGLMVVLAGPGYVTLTAILALIAYLGALSVIFGKQ